MAQHGIQIFYEPTSCTCEQRTYTRDNIQAAAAKALSLASEKGTIGEDKYPHAYNDYEHFKFGHAEMPYLEYPIENENRLYEGSGKPGPDRVVIGSIAEDYRSAVFCAVMTHDGQKHDGFDGCHDDTSKPHATNEHEVHEHEGREHEVREREVHEHENHEHENREHQGREHEGREHESREHEVREHEVHEHEGREHEGREQEGREHEGREHEGREQEGHEEKNPGNRKLVKHIELH